jgi:tRNA splicing endonuclease
MSDVVDSVETVEVVDQDVSVLTEDRVLSVLSTDPLSRAEVAQRLGVEANQKLTNVLLTLREKGRAVSQGVKRGAKWSAVS